MGRNINQFNLIGKFYKIIRKKKKHKTKDKNKKKTKNRDLSLPTSYFLRTWMMLTELFLSSGPTHCSMRTPSLNSPLTRPKSTSIENCGGFHSGTVTGHPPNVSITCLNGTSPIFCICSAITKKKNVNKLDNFIPRFEIEFFLLQLFSNFI